MNATKIPEIHISDVRAFRSCRRKWEWSSPLKRNLEPYVVYPPFFTGRAIHEALEMHYRDGMDLVEAYEHFIEVEKELMQEQGTLWPQEEAVLEEQIDLGFDMLQHYRAWQQFDDKVHSDKNLVFLEMEYPFVVSMRTPRGGYTRTMKVAGRFDGLVYNKLTEEYWIWETKTTRSTQELINTLATDEQSALYLYAARKVFDVPITGVLYNMLRKKAPTKPRVLQNGLLSKAAIDTTAFHYYSCVKEICPDWEPETVMEFYGDKIMELQENESKYFLRWPVYKTQTEIDSVMEGVYHTAKEMINPRTQTYPSPGWLSCNFCHFKGPCLAKNMGQDYEILLSEEYRERTDHIQEEGDNNG